MTVIWKRLFDSKKFGSWLIFCCKKLPLGLWKYSFWLKMGFGSTLIGLKTCIREVAERLMGSKAVASWQIVCCKKLWKYSLLVEDGLWKYSHGVEDWL